MAPRAGIAKVEQWSHGAYIFRSDVPTNLNSPIANVISVIPASTVAQTIQGAEARLFMLLMLLFFGGGIIAGLLSRWLAYPLSRLATMVSRTSNAIFLIGEDGRITWTNAVFIKMFGFSNTQAVGALPEQLLCPNTTTQRKMSENLSAHTEKFQHYSAQTITMNFAMSR